MILCKIMCQPWVDKNFKIESNKHDILHSQAVKNNDEISWHLYRNQRNKVNCLNKSNKAKYYEKRLNLDKDKININTNINNNDNNDNYTYSNKKMWGEVKKITNKTKQVPLGIFTFNNFH